MDPNRSRQPETADQAHALQELNVLEPLTHFLTGAVISRAGLNRTTALATVTTVLAAEAPDIDVVVYLRDPVLGFAHHRGITHTFVGTPFVAALVVAVVYLAYRLTRKFTREREPAAAFADPPDGVAAYRVPRWGLLYLYACIAVLSHILLDFTNNYGVRPFMPFVNRWYSWDIVFIFEPLLYVLLFGGLLLPALFGLIHEEIGIHRKQPRGRAGAIAALVGMLVVWGVRDYEHRRALAAMDARLYHGEQPIRYAAYPYYLNPFKWYGVVETEKFYERMIVDSLTPEVDPQGQAQIRYKPEDTPVAEAARNSLLGRVYLNWARYPVIEVQALSPPQSGYLVRFLDLRFLYPERRSAPLGAYALVTPDLQVGAQWFGRRGPQAELFRPSGDSR